MDIKAILKKIADGKELSAEEKDFLSKYDPENGDGNRIPKSRLDEEISKHKAEKERADALDSQLQELQTRIEELESTGKSAEEKAKAAYDKEFNKLKKQVEDLTKERDAATASLAKSERTARVSTLASKHNFKDSSYLDFLAASKDVDLNDETAVTAFMKELGKSSPELFKSEAKPGGGTKNTGKQDSGAAARLEELLKKPELSSREAGEVIRLQGEVKSAEGGNQGDGKNQNQGE
ncbi:MAG: hypothetical protein PHI85_04995 [Victivallaceae bacterium]|nr:hypothetical protein [Victivallaceae bacterium]